MPQLGWLPNGEARVGEQSILAANFESPLDYVHRHAADVDIYFLRNGSSKTSTQDIVFRYPSSAPEMWNPVTGERFAAASPSVRTDGRTQVSITLSPSGSIFVLFPHQESERLARQPITEATQPLKLDGRGLFSFSRGGEHRSSRRMPSSKAGLIPQTQVSATSPAPQRTKQQ